MGRSGRKRDKLAFRNMALKEIAARRVLRCQAPGHQTGIASRGLVETRRIYLS